ncbi:MAG: hypothetical protein EPN47_16940 [Acidobacteria bacterium]|nr:MAG: hypothetical protein EPN47_16940 [Acidobacteriota bacterium]
MASSPLQRDLLVLTDDVSIRNLFYLVRSLAIENPEDGGGRALAAIAEREQYDAVILDMRYSGGTPRGGVYGVGKIQSSMTGRMLTIIAEVDGLETPPLVERYLFSGLPGARMAFMAPRFSSPWETQPS